MAGDSSSGRGSSGRQKQEAVAGVGEASSLVNIANTA